jgi:hypothetical protein
MAGLVALGALGAVACTTRQSAGPVSAAAGSSFASYAQDDAGAESEAAQSERPSVRESLSGQTVTEQGRQLPGFLRQDEAPSPA